VRLENVMQWMQHLGVVSADAKLSTWLAFGFLLVCLVNTVGLLLAKFSARAGEIGVRRALGATKPEIFRQFLTEAPWSAWSAACWPAAQLRRPVADLAAVRGDGAGREDGLGDARHHARPGRRRQHPRRACCPPGAPAR
jgi:cell division protein FtsX